jgi:hypothetical protein
MEVTGIYRIFHPATAQCAFFLAACRTLGKKQLLPNIRKVKQPAIYYLIMMQ